MKVFFKYITLLLVFAMLFGIIAFAEENVSESSLQPQTEAISIIRALGLSDPACGPQNPKDIVSRAQFANIAANLRGISNDFAITQSEIKFLDIPNNFWCKNQIYSLKEMSIMSGENEYQFSPDSPVTYAQALKAIVSIVGFDAYAKAKGGYPNGYLYMGSSLGITSGIKCGADDSLDFETTAKLVYQTFDVDIMMAAGYEKDVEYTVVDGRTVLSQYFDIYQIKGIVTDNGITTLTAASGISLDQIKIGDTVLNSGAQDYIGYNVNCYYKDKNDTKEIMYIAPYKNDVIEINSDMLQTTNPKFSKTNIVYENGDSEKNAKISRFADMIYNGVAYPIFDAETMKILSGKITLIDNDMDGEYDVIYADEYENCYVGSVDFDMEKIYSRYGGVIELEAYETVKIYNNENKQIGLTDIKDKEVLSIFKSKDNKLIKLIAAGETVTGEVTSISNANDTDIQEMTLNIADKEYKIDSNLASALKMNFQGLEMPEIGEKYTFYLDIAGDIAGIETADGVQYAYLVNAKMMTGGVDTETALFRLYMPNGEFLNTSSTNKVVINGQSTNSNGKKFTGQDIINLNELKNSDGSFLPQLIRCKLNYLGELCEIETTNGLIANSYGYDASKFSMVYKSVRSTYRAGNQRSFDGNYNLSSNAVIFLTPPVSDFDENDLKVIKPSSLSEGQQYSIILYDANTTLSCAAACVDLAGVDSYNQSVLVVDRVSDALSENGETVKKVTGIYGKSLTSFLEKERGIIDNCAAEGLAQGDIVRIVTTYDGKIEKIQLLLSPSKNPQPFIKNLEGGYVDGDWVSIYGYIYGKSSDAISVLDENGPTVKAQPYNGTPSFILYDAKNKLVRAASVKDIITSPVKNDGTIDKSSAVMVYVYRRRAYCRNIVIIKN